MTECRVCGIEKREENGHWKVIYSEAHQLPRTSVDGFFAYEWNETYVRVLGLGAVFACGEQHALILFERWLATKNFEQGPQKKAQVSA